MAKSGGGTKRVFVTMLVTSLVLATFISCVGHFSSSAQQGASASPKATVPARTNPPPVRPRSTPARSKPSAPVARQPSAVPHTTAPAAAARPRPTPPIPVGAIAGVPRAHRPVASAPSKPDSWHIAAIIIWIFVGVLILVIGALAIVARRQRDVPLTYVRPRTDPHDRS